MTKIIGIDPAPSKESTVYDGEIFHSLCFEELNNYLKEIKAENKSVLICWDAPLSFSMKDVTKKMSPLYQRKIEYFFSRKDGYKTPTGISVLGYAGCPHWVISQYLLGYPKISSFEKNFNPPFELIFDKKDISHSVTEVHPAVAIWLWTKDKTRVKNWKYKKEEHVLKNILHILKNKNIIAKEIADQVKNDDYLDAYIAWKLGKDWVENNNVEILGNADTGSFLLPYNKNLFEKFKKH